MTMRRMLNAVPKARIAAAMAALGLGGCVSNGYLYDDPSSAVYSGGGYYAPGSYYSGGNYYYPYGPQGYYAGNRWVSRPLYYNHVHHGDHCDHPSHHGHNDDDDGHDGRGGNDDHDGQNHADGRGRDYLDRRGEGHRDGARSDGTHTQGTVISNGQPARGDLGVGRDYRGARGQNGRGGGHPQVPASSNRSGDVKPPLRVAAPKEARVAPARQPATATPKAALGRHAARSEAADARSEAADARSEAAGARSQR